MPLTASHKHRQRGNAIVEFALVIMFLLTLLLGTFSIGMTLTKSVQAGVVARDAGAMFMRYVDFTVPGNRALLVRLANGLGMTDNGGQGVVIMTQILHVGPAECAAGGLAVAACPNNGFDVVTKRMVVGNPAVYTTTFGNPGPGLIQPNGEVLPANYLTQPAARATGFAAVMTLTNGESAFVSEAWFRTPEIDLPGFRDNTYVYQRNVF
jgi:hypothetical protein